MSRTDYRPPAIAYESDIDNIEDLKLSVNEKLFVIEFVKDFNGARAYKESFGGTPTSTIFSLSTMACNVKNRPHVARAIKLIIDQQLTELDINQAYLIQELKVRAFVDPSDFYEDSKEGGKLKLKPIEQWTDDMRRSVKQITFSASGEPIIQLCDKDTNLQRLMQQAGLLNSTLNASVRADGATSRAQGALPASVSITVDLGVSGRTSDYVVDDEDNNDDTVSD